jgi:hypothetical protein
LKENITESNDDLPAFRPDYGGDEMKITNKLGLPEAFVQMAQSDYKPTPKRYSATALLKGVREVVLERSTGMRLK